jgi:hypothetical protein
MRYEKGNFSSCRHLLGMCKPRQQGNELSLPMRVSFVEEKF